MHDTAILRVGLGHTVARQKFESSVFTASPIRQLHNILYADSNLILCIPAICLNDCLDTVRHGVRQLL
jgi:hypothetical protein